MLSADGQVALVFNGEIYNFRDLAAELRDAGVQLRTRSDTEVLLELYRLHGPSFVSKMRGMFAFAIWDAPRRRLVLGRDRLGKKPLFFHIGKRGLSFASELQALLADGDIERRADRARDARLPGARLRAVRLRRHRGRAQAGARQHRRVRGRQAGRGALLEAALRAARSARRRTSSRSCATTCSRR